MRFHQCFTSGNAWGTLRQQFTFWGVNCDVRGQLGGSRRIY